MKPRVLYSNGLVALGCILLASGIVLIHPFRAYADGARLFKSGPIQITADGVWVWAANQDHDSVSRVCTTNDAVTELALPDIGARHRPRGLSVTEDGSEVWVACHDSDRVYVLSGADGGMLGQVDLPWGSGPYSVALSPDQTKALVTLHRAAALAVLDVATRQVIKILEPVYWSPMGIAWTEDGQTAIVTHLFAEGEHPFLTRVDVSGFEPAVRTRMTVFATDPRNAANLAAPYNISEGGYLTMRGHPAQIPSVTGRQEVWLPMQYNNITETIYTPDSTVQSVIRRLHLNTMTIPNGTTDKVILTAVFVHDPANGNPYLGPGWDARVAGPIDIGFSVDGAKTYLLHEVSDDLVVMPSNTPLIKPVGAALLPEITVGDRPTGMAVSPTEDLAYVYNLLSRDISVVDLTALQELRRIPVIVTSAEPMTSSQLHGAHLFHTSDDARISANNKVGCASCHINAEHDGRSWAFHRLPGPHGPREVPSLLGLGLTMGPRDPATGLGQLHRSGDRDEVQDFEHTFQGINMGGGGFLGAGVQPELGMPNAGLSSDLDDLAAYLVSLDPIMRSPYRKADGSLSEAAVRGATFFAGTNRVANAGDAGCVGCHVPETGFVDFKFHDVGSRRPGTEEELNTRPPLWHVNTPTLVGVWTTPPYAGVAGFATTILGVIEDQAGRAASATPHGFPNRLTRRQKRDLAEFVLSIDGNMTAAEARDARDTTPPRLDRVEVASLRSIDVWFSESVRATGATNVGAWRLEDELGQQIPISDVAWDGLNGDRVTILTRLQPMRTYRLTPSGVILDLADTASGGVANAMDLEDPANARTLAVGAEITVTLGASGYENITIPVHDTAMVGPSLSTWSHDSVWLFPVNSGPRVNTGFVRFDWKARFSQATGVAWADKIVEARVALTGEYGDAQTVELRRTLLSWSDPATGGDWNQNATGAPTWRDHSHPDGRWNVSGAGRLGGTGSAVSDYNGVWDLSARVDATADLSSINEHVSFAGPLVTDAFRFWFDQPNLDYGYAFRLVSTSTQAMKFERNESEFQAHGPVLTLTYGLPEPPRLAIEGVDGEGSVHLTLEGEIGQSYLVEQSPDFQLWVGLTNITLNQAIAPVTDDQGGAGGGQQFYRARTQ